MMELLFDSHFIGSLLQSTLRVTTPLLLVALGELYGERAGMINIGLDGIMTVGATVGFLVGYITVNPVLGLVVGALAGMLINMIYAYSTITLRSGQIINGMALNILAHGFVGIHFQTVFWGHDETDPGHGPKTNQCSGVVRDSGLGSGFVQSKSHYLFGICACDFDGHIL